MVFFFLAAPRAAALAIAEVADGAGLAFATAAFLPVLALADSSDFAGEDSGFADATVFRDSAETLEVTRDSFRVLISASRAAIWDFVFSWKSLNPAVAWV